jgi:hypothetical protein
MGYSAKIKIDDLYKRDDGTSAIFLQVIIDRVKTRIGLGVCWPPEKFSPTDFCKPRFKKDPDCDQYNAIINNALGKANAIRKEYLLRDEALDMDNFLRQYNTQLSKNDFIQYFAAKSFDRWRRNIISDTTYKGEKVTVGKLTKFYTAIAFNSFRPEWAFEFDRLLKNDYDKEDGTKKEITVNTRWARHKHVVTYLNFARKENINFIDPYSRFKNRMQDSPRKALELSQLKQLIEAYIKFNAKPLPVLHKITDNRNGLTYPEVVILRRFLFSCNCALRISDLQKLEVSMFNNGQMTITPGKTQQYGTLIDDVPLNDVARMLLDHEILDNPKQKIFDRFSDQHSNRVLKTIARKLGIDANLHHHVGRYTYASIMDQAGANHTSLLKLMGLRKRSTLEKYVKTNKKVMKEDVDKMNQLIKGH